MYHASIRRSSVSSSSRFRKSSSPGLHSSRSGTSRSTRSRSRRHSRSPSRGRRRQHHSRSPSPGGRRRRHHRSSSRRRSSRRSLSPHRSSRRHSLGWHSRSPDRRAHSPVRYPLSHGSCFPGLDSESSVERGLQITVDNERYGTKTPERKRLSDRLDSPVDSLSDVDRDDLADGPVFSRHLSHLRSSEQCPSREEDALSPFNLKHDEDYRNRDISVYGMHYDCLQDQSCESGRVGRPLRNSLDSSEDRGHELKSLRYDRNDRLIDISTETRPFFPRTQNYHTQNLSRSPSPAYQDEDFRELEIARRKREEELLSKKLSEKLPSSGYMVPSSSNPLWSLEPQYLYRPEEAPAMPKKSILKKRVDDPSVQPKVFSVSEPPPLDISTDPFSSEVENFFKQFNTNAVKRPAPSKELQGTGTVSDWQLCSGQKQNVFSSEQNSGNVLAQKECHKMISEPVDQQSDFLGPHERVNQDHSGFSGILGMMADSSNAQEKRRSRFSHIEDEEKFLYGDEETSIVSACAPEWTLSTEKGSRNQKVTSPSPPSLPVKSDMSEESRLDPEKIRDLLKAVGLDIGMAEISKLAARTQERLHGKKPSHSPDCRLVSSHKPPSQERYRSRSNTLSPDSSRKHSISPAKDTSSLSKSDYDKNKTTRQDDPAGMPWQPVSPLPVIPSAPPSLPNFDATSISWCNFSQISPFTAAQFPQSHPSLLMPPPGYGVYGHYTAYAASGWTTRTPQADLVLSDMHGISTPAVPANCLRPNLRAIERVSLYKEIPEIKQETSVLVQIPTTAPVSDVLPQPSLKGGKEKIADEKNRAAQRQKVIEEIKKLTVEQKELQKQLYYLRIELNRLSRHQEKMQQTKRKEKDPLLVEVNRLRENISKEITELEVKANAVKKKKAELDKVAQILGINTFEKSRKPSSEKIDLSEDHLEDAESKEGASGSTKL
nr:zinc finger protein 318-like [Pogona vitticeps]